MVRGSGVLRTRSGSCRRERVELGRQEQTFCRVRLLLGWAVCSRFTEGPGQHFCINPYPTSIIVECGEMHLLPDSLEPVSVKSGTLLQMIESSNSREKQ